MKVSYSKIALKEIDRLRDPVATKGLVKALDLLEEADDVRSVPSVKALAGGGGYFRIRLGDYRMGFRCSDDGNGILVMRVMHRREIYRHFPPK
jgi:mRNA interferase RelE/StbE